MILLITVIILVTIIVIRNFHTVKSLRVSFAAELSTNQVSGSLCHQSPALDSMSQNSPRLSPVLSHDHHHFCSDSLHLSSAIKSPLNSTFLPVTHRPVYCSLPRTMPDSLPDIKGTCCFLTSSILLRLRDPDSPQHLFIPWIPATSQTTIIKS